RIYVYRLTAAWSSISMQQAVFARTHAELALERALHPRRRAEAAFDGERLRRQRVAREQRARLLDAELVDELGRCRRQLIEAASVERPHGHPGALRERVDVGLIEIRARP